MAVLVRALTKLINEPKSTNYISNKDPLSFENIFVFDNETTNNEFQNMKIGYFRI